MELLTPGTGLLFWQVVVFAALFFLLSKMAWKPILSSLKERETGIANSLSTAERVRAEMAQMKNENEELLAQAREERTRMVKEAKEASDNMIAQAKEKARI